MPGCSCFILYTMHLSVVFMNSTKYDFLHCIADVVFFYVSVTSLSIILYVMALFSVPLCMCTISDVFNAFTYVYCFQMWVVKPCSIKESALVATVHKLWILFLTSCLLWHLFLVLILPAFVMHDMTAALLLYWLCISEINPHMCNLVLWLSVFSKVKTITHTFCPHNFK